MKLALAILIFLTAASALGQTAQTVVIPVADGKTITEASGVLSCVQGAPNLPAGVVTLGSGGILYANGAAINSFNVTSFGIVGTSVADGTYGVQVQRTQT